MGRFFRASVAGLALLASTPVFAADEWSETYGDWRVQYLTGDSTIASVTNSAGHMLGVICDQSGCQAFFNPLIECTDTNAYPALVNSPSGAFYVDLKCVKAGDRFLYGAPLQGDMSDAMSVGGVLGIAFPMASGQFKVARFSLTGAARASARAAQVAKGTQPNNKQNTGDSFSL